MPLIVLLNFKVKAHYEVSKSENEDDAAAKLSQKKCN